MLQFTVVTTVTVTETFIVEADTLQDAITLLEDDVENGILFRKEVDSDSWEVQQELTRNANSAG